MKKKSWNREKIVHSCGNLKTELLDHIALQISVSSNKEKKSIQNGVLFYNSISFQLRRKEKKEEKKSPENKQKNQG